MAEYYLIPRPTMEKIIELLENLESPHPTDFFVYLDILNRLKHIMHKIDINVNILETVYVDGHYRSRGSTQFPIEMPQLCELLAALNTSL